MTLNISLYLETNRGSWSWHIGFGFILWNIRIFCWRVSQNCTSLSLQSWMGIAIHVWQDVSGLFFLSWLTHWLSIRNSNSLF
jgi:hypothetical protein